ncbi:oxygen-insensitive NAD(P)H nitroreductase [Vibrio ishigakensis]|uniref:oxygen-insensitive NAD(P)H nitroreductase n=1 Tax=Vibrio ishigakensis TaxID=1481914 RepID=UPI0021C42FAB|nr:oxygen-insensitive NAD(P)H nitroreductase [Vibrio ishigakensis]
MNLKDVMQFRYSTKEFDPEKKISAEDMDQLKHILRYSPSSVNSQPWHFLIASGEESKQRVAKGAQGTYQFNEQKILDASHVVVLCARASIDEPYLLHLLESEDSDGRYQAAEFKDLVHGARSMFVNIHRYDLKDAQHWMDKQVYLNMGGLLLGAGALGIDALPMEGVDLAALDEEFELREDGFTAVAVVALGYRKAGDFNAQLPKSRLSEEEIFTELE